MVYILSFFGLLAVPWLVFHLAARRFLVKEIMHLSDLTKLGLAERLFWKYKKTYEEEFALSLASAVTNEICSESPNNDRNINFLKEHRVLIENETKAINRDKYICFILTQMIRARCVSVFSKQTERTPPPILQKELSHIEKLQEYGIFVSGGSAPDLKTLILLISEFYRTRKSMDIISSKEED